MGRRSFGRAVIISVAIATALSVLLWIAFQPRQSLGTVKIGTAMLPQSGLVLLAQKLGYFKKAGIDVEIKAYANSHDALQALYAGEVDLACAFDNMITDAYVHGKPLRILSQLHNAQRHTGIVVRKASGIVKGRDLKGRQIAIMTNSSLSYFLARFLATHNLHEDDVRIVHLPIEQAKEAFVAGKVDALVTWKGTILTLREQMGEDSLRVFYSETLQDSSVLVGLADVVKAREPAMKAVLRGLAGAFDFYLERRDDAYLSLLEALEPRFSAPTLMNVWAFMNLDMSLSNVLLLNMREQESWFEEQTKIERGDDIETIFDVTLLRAVRPDLVTIM